MDLVEEIYALTKKYPEEEKFSLTNHLRRSAISIPSNIAEGAARKGTKEFIQFLYVALGSLTELETQILLSKRLGYLSSSKNVIEKIEHIRAMLLGLIKSLKHRKT